MKSKELEFCDEAEEFLEIVNLQAIDNLTFENIIPIGTGRYTILFLTKINSINYFLAGLNIVLEGHFILSFLTDTLKDKISVYFFPKDYCTSPLKYN